MSRKFSFIPEIPDYKWIRTQMQEDLKYRLHDRQRRTSLTDDEITLERVQIEEEK